MMMMSVVMRRSLVKLSNRRSFGSAAAQLQEDYYYDDEEEEEVNKPSSFSSSNGDDGRGVQWVIMGDPTIRRHVYAERLSKILDVPHISMGTLVRQQLNPNSPLYKKIASAVNHGKLVPEDVIFSLLSKRLEDGYSRGESGFILDGIPRTTLQAEILDQIADIDLVLNLKSTNHLLSTNNTFTSPRHFHSPTNRTFNPQDIILKDQQQNKPLEEYYKRQNKLFDFQVAAAPGDTWDGLLAALHLPNTTNVVTSATNFTHKLMA